jgi:5-methylcytosine-specific restriction endonuclease McrA
MPKRVPIARPAAPAPPAKMREWIDRQEDKNFYSGVRWRSTRALFLKEHPLCARCLDHKRLKPAEHVHHLLERKDYPALAFEWSNLQGLCEPCHNRKRRERMPSKPAERPPGG